MQKQKNYFIIRAWDYDYIFGYVSKITNKMFMVDDSCFALKFKTRADAEKTIEILKSTGTELNFSVTEKKAGDEKNTYKNISGKGGLSNGRQ